MKSRFQHLATLILLAVIAVMLGREYYWRHKMHPIWEKRRAEYRQLREQGTANKPPVKLSDVPRALAKRTEAEVAQDPVPLTKAQRELDWTGIEYDLAEKLIPVLPLAVAVWLESKRRKLERKEESGNVDA